MTLMMLSAMDGDKQQSIYAQTSPRSARQPSQESMIVLNCEARAYGSTSLAVSARKQCVSRRFCFTSWLVGFIDSSPVVRHVAFGTAISQCLMVADPSQSSQYSVLSSHYGLCRCFGVVLFFSVLFHFLFSSIVVVRTSAAARVNAAPSSAIQVIGHATTRADSGRYFLVAVSANSSVEVYAVGVFVFYLPW